MSIDIAVGSENPPGSSKPSRNSSNEREIGVVAPHSKSVSTASKLTAHARLWIAAEKNRANARLADIERALPLRQLCCFD